MVEFIKEIEHMSISGADANPENNAISVVYKEETVRHDTEQYSITKLREGVSQLTMAINKQIEQRDWAIDMLVKISNDKNIPVTVVDIPDKFTVKGV